MDMPRPNAEHKKLERLVGTWTGKEKMYPSEWMPDGCVAEGRTVSRMALHGFAVVSDYDQTIQGQNTFTGHGVYTIDGKTNEVVLYWFDSMGTGCEEFRGSWNGDRLTIESPGGMMGRMRLSYEFHGDDKLASSMECSQDGKQWTRMFDGEFTREP